MLLTRSPQRSRGIQRERKKGGSGKGRQKQKDPYGKSEISQDKSPLLNSCHDSLDNNLHYPAPKTHLTAFRIPLPSDYTGWMCVACTVPPLAGCYLMALCWIRLFFFVPHRAELIKHHNTSHQYVKRQTAMLFERREREREEKRKYEMYLSVKPARIWPREPWWGLIAVWFEHPQTHSSSISLAAQLRNTLHCSRTQASARWILINAVQKKGAGNNLLKQAEAKNSAERLF